MKFIEVTELPKTNPNKKNRRGVTRDKLDEFMAMNIKIAKVVLGGDYINSISCYNTMSKTARYGCYPISVKMRNGEVYLIRRDI